MWVEKGILFWEGYKTMGEEENAGCQHFLLFPQCFPKASSKASLKLGIV